MGEFAISVPEDRIQFARFTTVITAIDPARIILEEHGLEVLISIES